MTTQPPIESLRLSIADPMQLFNSMDPAPFHERDLDSDVVDYIVDWVQELASNAALQLVVTLQNTGAATLDADLLRDAVHTSFRRRALASRRRLRRKLREGRISMIIGMAFLAAAVFASNSLRGMIANENYAWLLQESVIIGGWVALWHPLNIFLYDWWPIRAETRLFERLSEMQVQVAHTRND